VRSLITWFNKTGSPPTFDRFAARWAPWAFAFALVSLAVGLYGALFEVPADYQQGEHFRILYIHVPSAWMSLFVFIVMAVQAAIALVWRIKLCEILAMACAPVGALFTVVTLATGSIWGKPTWGTWWTWDARLTSVAILFVMYVGYLLLRGTVEDRERAARYCAVLGIVAALDMPLVHFSVTWWRTLHQPPTLMKPGGFSGSAAILWPLLVNLAAFTVLYAYLVAKRVRLLRTETEALA
jgi:heme exporter protein C